MVDREWGPLPDAEGEFPIRRGRFIDIEAYAAKIDNAIIDNATIDSATITNADIDSLSFDRITGGTNTGQDMVLGTGTSITLDTGGSFNTGTTGAVVTMTGGNAGAVLFYSGLAGEQAPGSIFLQPAGTGSSESVTLSMTAPTLGDVTNYGYGEVTVTGVESTTRGTADVLGFGAGTWAGIASLRALTTGSGNAQTNISAVSGSGTATIQMTAANGVVLASGTELLIDNGTVSVPSLAFNGDPDTGIYLSGTNAFAFAGGGTAYLGVFNTGSAATSGPYMYNLSTTGSAANLYQNGATGQILQSTSSLKYKDGWRHTTDLADVTLPEPIVWEDLQGPHIGFGMEHIQDVLPEAVDGEAYDVRAIVAVLSEKVKRLEAAYDL